MSLFDDIVLNDKKFHCMLKTFGDRTWDLLGSKELGTNVLELQCVMLANHDQNI